MPQTTVYAEAFPLLPTQMTSSSARNEVQSTYRTGRSTMTSPIFTQTYICYPLSVLLARDNQVIRYAVRFCCLEQDWYLSIQSGDTVPLSMEVRVLSKFSTRPSRQLRAL